MTVRTVTLSPGFDHEVTVDRISAGSEGKVLRWDTYASGKGLNVSRTIHWLGGETVAYTLVGAADERFFNAIAARDGVTVSSVSIDQPMRNNLTLCIESIDSSTGHAVGRRFSEVPESAVRKLFDRLVHDVSDGDIVSFNGALPDGFEAGAWAALANQLRDRNVTLFADVQDDALRQLLQTGLVHIAKPNHVEAQVLVSSDVNRSTVDSAVEAVRAMRSTGVIDPTVTLGALGAVHIVNGDVVRSECPPDSPRVEVGAGDAFVAGYCAAIDIAVWRGNPPVTMGLATASAHVDGFKGSDLISTVQQRLSRIISVALEPL